MLQRGDTEYRQTWGQWSFGCRGLSFEVSYLHGASYPGLKPACPCPKLGNFDIWGRQARKGAGRPLGPYGFPGCQHVLGYRAYWLLRGNKQFLEGLRPSQEWRSAFFTLGGAAPPSRQLGQARLPSRLGVKGHCFWRFCPFPGPGAKEARTMQCMENWGGRGRERRGGGGETEWGWRRVLAPII